ncbi:MAG: hypothetical protein Q8P40_05055, partial [Nitrospirota bacterium]|nr:hypothetical protein [Nitrospirota bacterium]
MATEAMVVYLVVFSPFTGRSGAAGSRVPCKGGPSGPGAPDHQINRFTGGFVMIGGIDRAVAVGRFPVTLVAVAVAQRDSLHMMRRSCKLR